MDEEPLPVEIEKALKWLVIEHHFFLELKGNLDQLREEITKAKERKAVSTIKAALRNFNYIGKVERRFEKQEKIIEEALFDLSKKSFGMPKIESLRQRLHVEAANLIRNSSLYEGKIKEYLLHLQNNIQAGEIEKAQQVLMEVEQLIDDTERWIAALSTDLSQAKELRTYEFSNKSPLEIAEEIKKSIPETESQFMYLGRMLKNRKEMPISGYRGLLSAVEILAEQTGHYIEAARILAESGEGNRAGLLLIKGERFEEAARLYEALGMKAEARRTYFLYGGEQIKKFEPVNDIVRSFLKAGVNKKRAYNLIASECLKISYYEGAAIAYEKDGNWKLAAAAWKNAGNFEQAGIAYKKAKTKGRV